MRPPGGEQNPLQQALVDGAERTAQLSLSIPQGLPADEFSQWISESILLCDKPFSGLAPGVGHVQGANIDESGGVQYLPVRPSTG